VTKETPKNEASSPAKQGQTDVAFRILPPWRMNTEFPWQVWAVGWLAIFKAFLWLATDPVIPSPMAERLAAKFLITMIPFLVLGIGVWNLRKWAVWGLVALCIADLLFFIVFSDASRHLMGSGFWGLSILLQVFNGAPGDILILIATPVLLKSAGRKQSLIHENN
jgi:hypothetical protein